MENKLLRATEIKALLQRLNTYAEQQDTPARIEGLRVEILGDEVRTSFSLVPSGNMDALKWNTMNEELEKMIRKYVASDLTGASSKTTPSLE